MPFEILSLFKERNLLKNNFDEMNYEYIFFKGKDEKTAAMPTILFRYYLKVSKNINKKQYFILYF